MPGVLESTKLLLLVMQLSSANSGSNRLGKLILSALRLELLCYLPASTSETLAIYLLGYNSTGIMVGYLSGLWIVRFADPVYDCWKKKVQSRRFYPLTMVVAASRAIRMMIGSWAK